MKSMKVAAFSLIICIAASITGCAVPLSAAVLGTWKGHVTTKSRSEMRKEAVTFTFSRAGNVEIVLDDGRRETNQYRVIQNRSIRFIEADKEKAAVEWFPALEDDVLDGPIKPLDSENAMKASLRLKRVTK